MNAARYFRSTVHTELGLIMGSSMSLEAGAVLGAATLAAGAVLAMRRTENGAPHRPTRKSKVALQSEVLVAIREKLVSDAGLVCDPINYDGVPQFFCAARGSFERYRGPGSAPLHLHIIDDKRWDNVLMLLTSESQGQKRHCRVQCIVNGGGGVALKSIVDHRTGECTEYCDEHVQMLNSGSYNHQHLTEQRTL